MTRPISTADQNATTVIPARAGGPWAVLFGSLLLTFAAAWYIAGGARFGVLIGGTLISFVLFWVMRAEVRARTAAERSTTALMESQQAVRSSEHRFRTLFEQSPLSIQIFAPTGECLLANRAWQELWQSRVEERVGYNILNDAQLAAGGNLDEIKKAFGGQTVALAATYYDPALNGKAGRPRWVQALYPVQDTGGELLEMVLIQQDVTERKQAEEERAHLLTAEREARAQAEAANRTKDEFLAMLSHELRTPLNAILGWSQLLRIGAVAGEEVPHALETIERNARVQAQLVEDLLDLSRIITGKLKLQPQPVDLPAVVDAAIDSVRPTAEAKGVRLIPVLDSHATPVMGDAHRLQQVAWNLLSNAIKFTPKGGAVEVYLTQVNSQAELSISDTGMGISDEFLPYVFDRLRQADSSSTRRHGGLGLGLAIARHLVEIHGGSVGAYSAGLGKGATFSVLLPLASPSRMPRPKAGAQATKESAASVPLDGIRVMIVDDESDARDLLGKILSSGGAQVTTASSAAEALGAFPTVLPHVLLSDISMPDEDGYSLIRRVRSLPESQGGRVPAVALTALARPQDRREALLAGFQMHLAKPIEPAELTEIVARLSGKR